MNQPYATPMDAAVKAETYATDCGSVIKKFRWGAVLAGVAVALAVHLLLSLLGTGLGMSLIEPAHQEAMPSGSALGKGAALWWSVSSLIALALGGWTAAHLAALPTKLDCALHGLLVWALTTLLGVYLLGSAVSSAVSGVNGVLKTLASGASVATVSVGAIYQMDHPKDRQGNLNTPNSSRHGSAMGTLHRQASHMLNSMTPAMKNKPESEASAGRSMDTNRTEMDLPAEQVKEALGRLLARDPNAQGPEIERKLEADRKILVNALKARGISESEAEEQVADWDNQAQQMRLQALEAAEAAAKAATRLALLGALSLFLGMLIAMGGGIAGASHHHLLGSSMAHTAAGRQPMMR